MGALLSVIDAVIRKIGIMSPRDDEEVDSKTGLKVKEKRAITQSWKHVSQNLKQESMNFFNLLFTEHPAYIEYFPAFRGKKLEEFNTKPKFIAHAKNVFYALTLVVDSLDEPDELVEILLKTGRDHHNRGVPMAAFHNLAIVFDKFLTIRLGNNYTPLAKESWTKALTVVNAVIEKGIEDEKAANLEKEKTKQEKEQSTDTRL